MSLLRKLERRDYGGGFFTNPPGFLPPGAIPTNGQLGWLGGGGYPVSSEMAMRHATVWACVRIIADVVSTLPIDVLTGDPVTGATKTVDPTPTKITTPSAYATRLQWLWQVMASLLLRGNAYGMISAIDRLGYPSQVDLLPPEQIQVIKGDDGKKRFRVAGNTDLLTTSDVWHLPGPQLPGALEGLSPIRFASRTIGLGLDAEQWGSDYFRNGIHPTATFQSEQTIKDDQAEEIKKRVKRAQSNRDLVVLGAGGKLVPWQLDPAESQFLETQRVNAVAIAQIFGVPPEMIGEAARGSSITYANREQRAQDFLNNAVNQWLTRLEEALSAWFPRGTYIKFNTGALLRSDLLTRYQADQIAIQTGFMLRSEARALEDWPPIPGLDDQPMPTASPPSPTSPPPAVTVKGPSDGK